MPISRERIQVVSDFMQDLRQLKDRNPIYQSIYKSRVIGCMAIKDYYEDGVLMAYASNMPHRVPRDKYTWRLVHSPTINVVSAGTPYSLYQTEYIPEHELISWPHTSLGECPKRVFMKERNNEYGKQALFLYPENYLVERRLRQFVDTVCKTLPLETEVLIITKASVVLTDFIPEAIRIIAGN